jgi:uncharacterized protein YdiU (UPF0061 family)
LPTSPRYVARFAETLLPLIADGGDQAVEAANASLAAFDQLFQDAYLAGLRRKLGLSLPLDGDADLATDLLTRMAGNEADFTLTFRALSDAAGDESRDAMSACFSQILPPGTNGQKAGANACRMKASRHKGDAHSCAQRTRCSFRAITASRRRSVMRKNEDSIPSMNW